MGRSLVAGPAAIAVSGCVPMKQTMPRKARSTLILAAVLSLAVRESLLQSMCLSGVRSSVQSRFNARMCLPGTGRGQLAVRALSSGDALQVKFQEKWVDAIVDAELLEGVKVHFSIDGYEYHLLASAWRTDVQRPQLNMQSTGHMLNSPSIKETLYEFQNLSDDEWMDATIQEKKLGSFLVEVTHPRNNKSINARLKHNEFRLNPELQRGAKVRVRIVDVNMTSCQMKVSMLPQSFASDFAKLPRDLWLNGTITKVHEHGMEMLVEPPLGSAGGPRQGFVLARNIEACDGITSEKDLLSQKFSVGDEVHVRVTGMRSDGKLFLSMKDDYLNIIRRSIREKPSLSIHGTSMIDATIKNVSSVGLRVSFRLPNSKAVRNGFVPPSLASWEPYSPEVHQVGQEVKARIVNITHLGPVLSMLDKQNVSAWVDVPRTRWFQGVVAKQINSRFLLMKMQFSKEDQPVMGVLESFPQDGRGNHSTVTVGELRWVRVLRIMNSLDKLILTDCHVTDNTWVEAVPSSTWLHGFVRQSCTEQSGWFVRVQEPMEDNNGIPGRSCKGVLPCSEVEGVVANGTAVRVRISSMQNGTIWFTMKE